MLDLSKPYEAFRAPYLTLFLQDGHVYTPDGREMSIEEVLQAASPIDFPLLYYRLGLITEEQYQLINAINLRDSVYHAGGLEAGIDPEMIEEKVHQKILECGLSTTVVSEAIEELRQQILAEYKKQRSVLREKAYIESADVEIEPMPKRSKKQGAS